MALRAVAAVLVLLLAGCLGGKAPESRPIAGDFSSPDPAKFSAGVPTEFRLELDGLQFEESLVRYRLVAEEGLVARANWSVEANQFGLYEGCMVAAVTRGGEVADPEASGSALVLSWVPTDPDRPRVRAGSTSFEQNLVGGPFQNVEGDAQQSADDGEFVMAPGESLLVELGGTSNAGLPTGARAGVTVSATGAMKVEQLEDAAFRCGVTWFSATEATTVEGAFRIGSLAARATLGIETKDASTAYLSYNELTTVHVVGALQFLDETVRIDQDANQMSLGEKREFHQASTDEGTIGFAIDRWIAAINGYSVWFLADAYWVQPVVKSPVPN